MGNVKGRKEGKHIKEHRPWAWGNAAACCMVCLVCFHCLVLIVLGTACLAEAVPTLPSREFLGNLEQGLQTVISMSRWKATHTKTQNPEYM